MKRLAILLALLGALIAGCSPMSKAERAAEEARVQKAVSDSLAEGHYKVYVNYMYPLRGPAKSLSYGYYVGIHGDKIDSYLPYFGVVSQVPYGGGNGLNFNGDIAYYSENITGDKHEITINVKTDEDTFVYVLTIYENASATVFVRGMYRDAITFNGTLDTNPPSKK